MLVQDQARLDSIPRDLSEGDFSAGILRLEAFAKGLGYQVNLHDLRLAAEGVAVGRINFEKKTIRVAAIGCSLEALMILAHELGHHYTHTRYDVETEEEMNSLGRDPEALAFLYGWGVLRSAGYAPGLVTKNDWRDHHHHFVSGVPRPLPEREYCRQCGGSIVQEH